MQPSPEDSVCDVVRGWDYSALPHSNPKSKAPASVIEVAEQSMSVLTEWKEAMGELAEYEMRH